MRTIESPYTEKKLKKTIYNPVSLEETDFSGEILRIVQEEGLTRIDFVHYGNRIYVNGGWVRIDPSTFIRPVSSDLELTMVKAHNIPVAPASHYYRTKWECLYYTLYFPALPDYVEAIDIIEREAAKPNNYFNFYGVSLEKIATSILVAPN